MTRHEYICTVGRGWLLRGFVRGADKNIACKRPLVFAAERISSVVFKRVMGSSPTVLPLGRHQNDGVHPNYYMSQCGDDAEPARTEQRGRDHLNMP
ncbi:hypothetical protein DFR67_103472 [Williamsia limnetica]|uniref:Uncharacterized protein n=1 Tax=Williamsia limnetica TaxID=882452 RepID=A0A318S5Z9_WILLI|nr:hypothetical protein DFR67_103472 [Williamsia limnetica]